jgi:hypothetical protein
MPAKSNSSRRIQDRAAHRLAERNRRYYHAHKAEFLRKYKDKYIAIHNEQVIGVDASRSGLLNRMLKKFGDIPFFFTHVTVHPRVVHIPSYALRKPSTDR